MKYKNIHTIETGYNDTEGTANLRSLLSIVEQYEFSFCLLKILYL